MLKEGHTFETSLAHQEDNQTPIQFNSIQFKKKKKNQTPILATGLTSSVLTDKKQENYHSNSLLQMNLEIVGPLYNLKQTIGGS